MVSIFSSLIGNHNKWTPDDNDTAIICAIRNVSCPYCGGAYSILTLGALRPNLDKRMYTNDNRFDPNPRFKYTHLSNPIECPLCKKRYIVFVGVRYQGTYSNIKEVHVKISKLDDALVRENMRWPHGGLVAKKVIEYNPPNQVLLFDDIYHYLSYYDGAENGIKASSLANLYEKGVNSNSGNIDVKPPDVISLDNEKEPPPDPKYKDII